MLGLIIEHVGKVRREAGLREPHVETVRETAAQEPMVSSHPFGPGVGERHTVTAVHRELGPPRIRGPYLEPRREDQAVHFVFNSIHHDAVLSHSVDTLALGVY